MQFSTLTTNPFDKACDCLILLVNPEDKSLTATDNELSTLLKKLNKAGDFAGKKEQMLLLHEPSAVTAKRLLLVGTGSSELSPVQCHELLLKVAKRVAASPSAQVVLTQANSVKGIEEATVASLAAQAFVEARYSFTQFKSGDQKTTKLKKLSLAASGPATAIRAALKSGAAIGEGINTARNLGDLPGNVCTPTYLSKEAKALAKAYPDISCKVLNEKQLRELGMGSLLSVSAGSEQPPALIVMEYKGGKANEKPIALVGKGVTFDSGGISLKPGAAMDEMKYDMCGAASVFGTLKAVAESSLKINLVALVPAVENMPSGKATKPGDIVTSMSGQTIEVLNTDAEGRLILCDALTYAERYKPRFTVDIATLTGACVVALGAHASGLFSNDDELADALLAAGNKAGDRAWRMPLWAEYDKQLKSNFADMANIGGAKAGSVTAACFLARFTGKQRWAHIDIAGSAWKSGAAKGATGRPVALLVEFLTSQQ